MTVTNGIASKTVGTARAGAHQLTAVFTPANPATFGPSTSTPVTDSEGSSFL